jgi:glycosyltransferase 2 family protein
VSRTAMNSPGLTRFGLRWRLVVPMVLLGAIVFAVLVIYGDLPELSRGLREFPLGYLLIVLALSLVNYLLRMVRWIYYLRVLSIDIPVWHNILIFFSGFSMTISPGKVGDLAKCYLLSEAHRVPVSRSSPALIMERVTDLAAVFAITALGVAVLPSRLVILGGGAVVIVAVALGAILVVSHGRLLRLPLLRRWETEIAESRENVKRLLSAQAVIVGVALAVLAWLSEGVGLWVVLRGLDADLSLGRAVSVYAAATLIGALVLLPGGIVGTETSMVGLLQRMDVNRADASAATIIIRLCTLWFAVLLGFAALALLYWLVLRKRPAFAEAATVEAAALDTPLQSSTEAERGPL